MRFGLERAITYLMTDVQSTVAYLTWAKESVKTIVEMVVRKLRD